MKRYTFNIYSSKGCETVTCETSYKPIWQLKQEVEEKYRQINNTIGSVIITQVK